VGGTTGEIMTRQELHERIAGLHFTMLMMRLGVRMK
jgi:hypothetical protein